MEDYTETAQSLVIKQSNRANSYEILKGEVQMLSAIAAILATLLSLLILCPIAYFLLTTRKLRYNNLKAYLKDEVIKQYYTIFFPSVQIGGDKSLIDDFEKRYANTYGWKRFLFPLLTLFAILLISSLMIYIQLLSWFNIDTSGFKLSGITISAFFGAYSIITYDVFSKVRERSLSNYDLYIFSLRFIIAIPVGYIFSTAMKDSLGYLMAFSAAGLPIARITSFTSKLVSKKIGIEDKKDAPRSDLEVIQGINEEEANNGSWW